MHCLPTRALLTSWAMVESAASLERQTDSSDAKALQVELGIPRSTADWNPFTEMRPPPNVRFNRCAASMPCRSATRVTAAATNSSTSSRAATVLGWSAGSHVAPVVESALKL